MEDEATDEEKEMGAAWTRENILDPLHEEYERYAEAQRESEAKDCLLYTSPSPRDQRGSRMPSSA